MDNQTRPFKWHTTIIGARYADADYGSDTYGDGTQQRPYRTLEKALFGDTINSEAPEPYDGTIICRGYFRSNGSNVRSGQYGLNMGTCGGSHIQGDTFGIAIYDGEGKNCVIGFSHKNMVLTNLATPIEGETWCYNAGEHANKARWSRFVGVGRSESAESVILMNKVHGIASTTCVINDAPLLGGCLGSSGRAASETYNAYVVYSKPKGSAEHAVSLCSNYMCTIYDCNILNRSIRPTGSKPVTKCLFSKFDMIAHEVTQQAFSYCMFGADCTWYFEAVVAFYDSLADIPSSGNKINSFVMVGDAIYKITSVAGARQKYVSNGRFTFDLESYNTEHNKSYCNVSEMGKKEYSDEYERQLQKWFYDCSREAGVAPTGPNFVDCLFSRQTANEIFNDPENLDFTLSIGSDGYDADNMSFYGALSRCIRVPVVGSGNSGSDQHVACWDNRSIDGDSLSVVDGKILYNTTAGSPARIYSKVIRVSEPSVNTIRAIYNFTFPQFANRVKLNSLEHVDMFEREEGSNEVCKFYTSEDITESGLYLAVGTMNLNVDNEQTAKQVLSGETVTLTGNETFNAFDNGAYFAHVIDPNVLDVVYVRCAATCWQTTDIEPGKVYLNTSPENILYNGREIVVGESFVGVENVPRATKTDGITVLQKKDILRVFNNVDSGWVPASMCGNYFVLKSAGQMQRDNDGEYYSSGNIYSYANMEGTTDFVNANPKPITTGTSLVEYNGAEGDTAGVSTSINQPYVQFKIEVHPTLV